MAVPGHDKGRSVYREALSLTEHGQNAKALFLLNQLSDSLSMLHSGVSEQKLLMDVNGLKQRIIWLSAIWTRRCVFIVTR